MIERIRKILEESGLSQKDFAEKIGIPPTTLNGLFNGRANSPSAEMILAITENFGVSPLWILTGKGPRLTTVLPLSEDKIKEMDAHDRRVRKINTTSGAVNAIDDYLSLSERDRATVNALIKQLKG
ncbi:helix-turn-helix domain-containing protein [Leptospira kirschneri]|uniref:helix-turn-helix domain-containing protein n=1 Tax=Leptospira kirschneri TaxID=29507 RepID=UPI001F53C49B|nr:helix-turn-helix transcriptional regulator [Leptospira kirschneri]UML78930.1 helix-turn-helix transcriptional regulator [Leptospira kirschneri]